MIRFIQTTTGLDFEYQADFGNNNWVWEQLKTSGSSNVSSVFYFDRADLTNPPAGTDSVPDDYHYRFAFGKFEDEYVRISGRILGIDNDVLLPKDTKFKRTLFAAERNISIFGRIANLVDHNNPIVVGGTRKDDIPFSVFEELLDKFPNSYEMDRYAGARVHTVLSAYLEEMMDARGRYEDYLNKKMKGSTPKLDLDFLKKLEVEKYILIHDLIKHALDTKADLSEGEWQSLMMSFLLLLFPKWSCHGLVPHP